MVVSSVACRRLYIEYCGTLVILVKNIVPLLLENDQVLLGKCPGHYNYLAKKYPVPSILYRDYEFH